MDNLENKIEEEAQRVKPMVCVKVDITDVDDVMQDIRLSFFTAFPRFNGDSRLSTYAHSIAKSRVVDYFRKKYKVCETYKRLEAELLKRAEARPQIKFSKQEFCTLTESEKRVLRLVGEGMNNAEIAEVLYIKENTVRAHMKKIYRKLQYKDRVKLALFSYKFFRRRDNEN